MLSYGRYFGIANATANFRNLLSCRNPVLNVQPCATLKGRTLEKLGLPPKPKRPLSPFFRFLQANRTKLREQYPNMTHLEIVRNCANTWATTDYELKDELQKAYETDFLKYSKEMMAYQQSISPEQMKLIEIAKKQQQDKIEQRKNKAKLELLGKPKKPSSPFFLFLQENKYSKEKHSSIPNWIQTSAKVWHKLSPEEKAKFHIESQKQMEQHKRDLKEWEEKMLREGHSDLVRSRGLVGIKSTKSK